MPTPKNRSSFGNLPVLLSSFIGREREIREIRELLASNRLVTLTGPGGCGKTRLAIKVAQELSGEFAGGVWLVELAALSDEILVPQAVAQALNVREVPNQVLSETLANDLRARELLLVIDNCEHLITTCAQLVDTLLHACPDLRILATSREPLGIPGEIVWSVPSLSLPEPQPWHDPTSAQAALPIYRQSEAVQLFVERATAVSPHFKLAARNGAWIADICRRLDGIPLAIELAAARVRLLTVEHLAARLDDRFKLLTSGSRTAPPRHQTLYATLDWSYALLSETEQRLLRRLSIFAGGWTLEAAEEVCADEHLPRGEILDALARLVDKSLVVVQENNGAVRYHFLETIRQFARERLVESNEFEKMRFPHLKFFLRLAEEAEPLLFSPDQAQWFERLEMENDNFRAALEWALESNNAATALRWVGALWFFWFIRDHYREGQERLSRALAEPGADAPSSARARALNASGFMSWIRGDYAQARILFEEALTLANKLGDQTEIAMATRNLGLVSSWERDYATARVLLEKSVMLWRELGDKSQAGWALPFLADVVLYQGDLQRAQSLYEESAAVMREQRDKIVLAYPLRRMGCIALKSGDYEKAMALCQESLELNLQVGDKRGVVACLAGLAATAVARGQMAEAVRLFAAVQVQLDTLGITLYPADQMEYESNMALVREQLEEVAFNTAWSEGKTMTLEQSIAYTLEPRREQAAKSSTARRMEKEIFGGLTEREREVAALIAQGKSNREIATAMSVGVKTVETYVTRILSKLVFESRVQIATWAIEKGLK
ncbi:MAG TPA: tetratricopeptide repeat protein [Anaerolineales bacterium]|nr:tetratricopeptide repeat protein [Anaerolineales bacterium]